MARIHGQPFEHGILFPGIPETKPASRRVAPLPVCSHVKPVGACCCPYCRSLTALAVRTRCRGSSRRWLPATGRASVNHAGISEWISLTPGSLTPADPLTSGSNGRFMNTCILNVLTLWVVQRSACCYPNPSFPLMSWTRLIFARCQQSSPFARIKIAEWGRAVVIIIIIITVIWLFMCNQRSFNALCVCVCYSTIIVKWRGKNEQLIVS